MFTVRVWELPRGLYGGVAGLNGLLREGEVGADENVQVGCLLVQAFGLNLPLTFRLHGYAPP